MAANWLCCFENSICNLFFGKLYEEVLDSIDSIAEHIRALDDYAPGSFKRFNELSLISDTEIIPSDENMVKLLLVDNEKIINQLNKTFDLADQNNEQGLADFISSRLDSHKKHAWMLRSIIRKWDGFSYNRKLNLYKYF